MRLIASLLLVLSLSAPAFAESEPQLSVTGRGTFEATPDMATLTLGVTHEAKTAEDAMDLVSADVADVLRLLRLAGIEERDLQTSGLTLSPVWSNYGSGQARRITGFSASNMLTARVRDMSNLGEVLDDVIEEGANSFQGLSFGLQEPEPALDAARRAAVADAMAKARLFAEAAGVTLGPILSLSEAGAQTPRPQMMEMARMASDAVPVAPGELTISAGVSMVFEIVD